MTSGAAALRISTSPEALLIEWRGGGADEFSGEWLRDNLPEHRDPHNGQRLIDIADLGLVPRIRSATVRGGSVCLEWEGDARVTSFELGWLAAQVRPTSIRRPEFAAHRWLEGASLKASRDFAWMSLDEARDDPKSRLGWLTRLLKDGVAFLRGVPSTERAILGAMQWVGHVAETNYGLVFDVRSVPQPENLAYSDLGLGLHTDNPYRKPVPGFQALHTLISSPDGGDSLFADGFALAEHLRATEPESFDRLTRTPVPFHYRSQNAELYAERPLIELSCVGEVTAVHYNSRSIAPFQRSSRDGAAFYAAYRRFASLLRESRYQMQFKLQDQELVVFDNQRILHGRTAFSSARHPRHLQGCYLTRDSVYSSAGLLRRTLASEEPA